MRSRRIPTPLSAPNCVREFFSHRWPLEDFDREGHEFHSCRTDDAASAVEVRSSKTLCHPDRSRSASDGVMEGPAVLFVMRDPARNLQRHATVESQPFARSAKDPAISLIADRLNLNECKWLVFSRLFCDSNGRQEQDSG